MQVNRYLKREYIKEFEENGNLLIGSIDRCRKHEEQQKRDIYEGVRRYFNNGEEMDRYPQELMQGSNVQIKTTSGGAIPFYAASGSHIEIGMHLPNAYVLSCSSGIPEDMKKVFKSDSYFTILDTNRFGDLLLKAINEQIDEVVAYCFDWIEYIESKNHKYYQEKEKRNVRFVKPHLQPGECMNLSLIRRYFDNYFIKEKKRYELEKEFRFVFICEKPILKESIIVKIDPYIIHQFIQFNY